jgi:long-chain acyl-CoA synthetase
VELVPEPFTVENGLLTPTFKLKRPQAREAFQALIDSMYSRLPQGEAPGAPGAEKGVL